MVLWQHATPIYRTSVGHDGSGVVVPAILAELGRATGATCQKPVIQLRKELVERGVKFSIEVRTEPKLVVVTNFEGVYKSLDLRRVQLVPTIALGNVPETIHQRRELGIPQRAEQGCRRPERETGIRQPQVAGRAADIRDHPGTNLVEILTGLDGFTKYGLVEASERGTEVVEAVPFHEGHPRVKVQRGRAVRDRTRVVMMIRGGDWRRGRGGAIRGHVCRSLRSWTICNRVEFGQCWRGNSFGGGDLLFSVVVVVVV